MIRTIVYCKSFISSAIIAALCLGGIAALPQDIVASDDVTGGASIFVFRESRKKPQNKIGGRVFRPPGGSGNGAFAARIAANRKRRAQEAKANAAAVAKTRVRQRNARLAQSIVLTAKAHSQLEINSVDPAIAGFREALKLDPTNGDAARGLSDALTVKAASLSPTEVNSGAAAVLLDEAVKLDGRNDVARAGLGDLYMAAGRTSDAIASYESASRINPTLGSVYVQLGSAYLAAGDVAKAEAASRNAERLGASDAEAQNLKGIILYRQNKNAEAMAVFDGVLKSQARNATARYYQALVFDRLNQPDQSVAAFREAVAAEPSYSQAWFDLGVAYYNQGNYAAAANSYQQAVTYDPTNAQTHANLASTYRQLERFPEANAEYRLAEANGMKDNADLYSEWGYCLGKTDQWDASVARLEAARQISPAAIDDSNAGWGYYNSAQNDRKAKNETGAAEKLQKGKASLEIAVRKDPKLAAAYLNLGSTDNALGNFQAAVAALNVALGLRGDWVIALNQLGLGYRGMNNLSAALTQFNRAVTIDTNYVAGLFNLGSTQNAAGDKKGAKRTQERLKKLSPELASRLANVIAGKVMDEAEQQIRNKIKIPKIPF